MPPLGFDVVLRGEDIRELVVLTQQQPVWLLKGDRNSSLVVKAESVGTTNAEVVRQAMKIMGIVSPQARMKIMLPSEVNEFRSYVKYLRLVDDHEDQEWSYQLNFIQTNLDNSMRAWMKMETLRLTSFEDGNDAASKKIGKVLNAPDGLEDMGKIIAADLFNGNNDRFNFLDLNNTSAGVNWGVKRKQLHYLTNPGNFMIHESGNGEAKLLGMDPFDRSTRIGGLDSPVGQNWGYGIFHPQRRGTEVPNIAERCAYDLKKVVGKTTGMIVRARLDGNAARRIAAGMLQGAGLIEGYFKQKYQSRNVVRPNGLASRAQAAGWDWFGVGMNTNQAFQQLTERSRRQYN